ncbi:MAG: ABC transporter ATP-binding protein [Planctomycetota bacterium]
MDRKKPLLEIRGLKKWFPIHKGVFRKHAGDVRAVDGLDFDVGRTETVSLVGESGCGKTTAGRSILRLIEPTGGSALFRDNDREFDLFQLHRSEMRALRRNLQIIFQDPFASLNPRIPVSRAISEALEVHRIASGRDELDQRVAELMELVGLRPEFRNRYPHEFSGGQRQRIGIARALALKPRFIVCDEAVSALDVSIQAQVVNLLKDLQREFELSYLFIAHDLSVVKYISDRIAVMYLGRIVEMATATELFENPSHPYTQALLSAVPRPDPTKKKERIILQGDVPSPIKPPSGCHFHTRCPVAKPVCKEIYPGVTRLSPPHTASCHWLEEWRTRRGPSTRLRRRPHEVSREPGGRGGRAVPANEELLAHRGDDGLPESSRRGTKSCVPPRSPRLPVKLRGPARPAGRAPPRTSCSWSPAPARDLSRDPRGSSTRH